MIDTLNIAKEFQMVGFSQAQSEMMATQMVQIHQNNQYATKADLKALGQEMRLEPQKFVPCKSSMKWKSLNEVFTVAP